MMGDVMGRCPVGEADLRCTAWPGRGLEGCGSRHQIVSCGDHARPGQQRRHDKRCDFELAESHIS
jgi:hypothetical protein